MIFLFLSIRFPDEMSQVSDTEQKNVVINNNLASSSPNKFLNWNFTWGGNGDERPWEIALDSLGNIYIAGTILRGTLDAAIFLAKFNGLGQFQWNRTFDKGGWDTGGSIAIDSMDNIFVGGTFENVSTGDQHIIVIKYDYLGNYLSNITWGSGPADICNGIALDSAENIYITGFTTNPINLMDTDVVLIKYDSLGNLQWNYTWGGDHEDFVSRILIDYSDNIYLAGQFDNSSSLGISLFKYNNLGEYQWNRTWDASAHDAATGIVLDSSNNIYVSGYTLTGPQLSYDMVLIKYNNTGTLIWNRTWGRVNYLEVIINLVIDSEDNLYLAGAVNYTSAKLMDFCFMQFKTDGEQQFNHTWGSSRDDILYAITIDSSDNIFLAGLTNSSGNLDVYLAKYPISIDNIESPEIYGMIYLF